jgi:hypothetical protein
MYNIISPAPHRPGVHPESTTQTAGYSFEKLETAYPTFPRGGRQRLQSHSGAAPKIIAPTLHARISVSPKVDYHTPNAAISNEQI